MPTYEYACTDCGERVETFQRITDPPLEVCDACGGKLRKLFHPVGIAFKGSGFYTTDSRPKESSKKADGDGGKTTSSDTKTSGATEKTA